jgi:uncharacterized membrane protein YeaQ/YmgE (transglycosylase-associated protein family)
MIKKKWGLMVLLGILVGVFGYWTADFSEKGAFSEAIYSILGPGAFAASFLSTWLKKKDPGFNALMISLGILVGMLSRIFSDMISDPSSHGFLPYELMLGMVIVFPASFLGSFLVWGIFQVSGKN